MANKKFRNTEVSQSERCASERASKKRMKAIRGHTPAEAKTKRWTPKSLSDFSTRLFR